MVDENKVKEIIMGKVDRDKYRMDFKFVLTERTEKIVERAIEAFRKLLLRAIDDLPKQNWIYSKDRLPKVPDWMSRDECPEYNVFIKFAEEATTLRFRPNIGWFDDRGVTYEVVAWQPLPDLPEEGN